MTPDDPRHGTANGYNNRKCRCDSCKDAWRLHCMAQRRKRGVRPKEEVLAELRASPVLHGRESGYKRGCRCPDCMKASADARRGRAREGCYAIPYTPTPDALLIRRDRELRELRETLTGELAALAREQELDERFGYRVGHGGQVSLDSHDRFGRELHETFAA